jgi:hypothetical protein
VKKNVQLPLVYESSPPNNRMQSDQVPTLGCEALCAYTKMKYIQLIPDTAPPDISGFNPFRAIVIVEENVAADWQHRISKWLVSSGCLYMMAWGVDSSSWDDCVDGANLEEWKSGDIPSDNFVMTTWHENESLEEVFWFAKHNAIHPSVEITNTLLVHISKSSKEDGLLDQYNRA